MWFVGGANLILLAAIKVMASSNGFKFSSTDFQDICCYAQTGQLDKLKSIITNVNVSEAFGTDTFCPCPKLYLPSPIVLAAQNQQFAVLEYFIETFTSIIDINKGATVVSKTQRIKTHNVSPLLAACTVDDLEVVKYLVKMGADIHKQSLTKATPLRAASYYGYLDTMEYLIENGADIDTPNSVGSTPFLAAAAKGGSEATIFLLKKGCNPLVRTIEGHTAMHVAAERGNAAVVKALLGYGMSPYFSPSHPKPTGTHYAPCPLFIAASMGHKDVFDVLIDHPECTLACKADANLLLATSILEQYAYDNYLMNDTRKSLQFWIKGLEIMEQLQEPIPTLPQIREYLHRHEIRSPQHLQTVWDDPGSMELDIPIQCLMIRERCLGVTDQSLIECLVRRGSDFILSKYYKECECVWSRAMFTEEQLCDFECSHPVYGYCDGIMRALKGDMTDYINGVRLMVEEYTPDFSRVFQFGLKCLQYLEILKLSKADGEVITLQPIISCLLDLLYLWITHGYNDCNQLFTPSDESVAACRKLVDSYLTYSPNSNLLVDFLTNTDTAKRGYSIVLETLLACGGDECINDTLPNGDRPIKLIFSKITSGNIVSDNNNSLSILIKYGAHVDAVDHKGETFRDWRLLNITAYSYMMSLGPLQLSCFAAQAVVRNNIDYHLVGLPSHITSFIKLHDWKHVESIQTS